MPAQAADRELGPGAAIPAGQASSFAMAQNRLQMNVEAMKALSRCRSLRPLLWFVAMSSARARHHRGRDHGRPLLVTRRGLSLGNGAPGIGFRSSISKLE